LRRPPAPAVVAISAVWSLGAALMVARLCLRLRAERRDAPAASGEERPAFLAQGVPVGFSGGNQGPAVDGLLRPRISLPSGIEALLSKRELDAVLLH